jgi:hypothetical protein
VLIEFSGIKKGPLEEPAYRAWVLSPDGYTILPMRLPTTRMIVVKFFMVRSVNGKSNARQRLLLHPDGTIRGSRAAGAAETCHNRKRVIKPDSLK